VLRCRFLNTRALRLPLSTTTSLPNGLVLVSGGEGLSAALTSAELYDPSTGVWTQTGSMTSARFRHSQTLLLNGLVLVAGGLDAVNMNSISNSELYDPAAGTWTTTGSLNVARAQHTATLMPNGLVAVVGGFHGPTPTNELYDPATATWSLSGDMIRGRAAHATVLLPSGAILVIAGYNTDQPSSPEFDDFTLKETEIGTLQAEPPVITIQPKNQRVQVGETATFRVRATGTPPLTYQWTKNGTEIPGAVAAKYTTPPATAEDDGSLFAVTVSNSGGSVTSRSATLFIR